MTQSEYAKMGHRGEKQVARLLQYYGMNVTHYDGSWDLTVDGKRVEVKTAMPHVHPSRPLWWKFTFVRNGVMPPTPDFYILRLQPIPGITHSAIHLLLDGDQQRFQRRVSFRSLMNGDFRYAERFRDFCKRRGEFAPTPTLAAIAGKAA